MSVNKRQRAGTDLIQGSTYWWSWSGGTLVTVKHIFGSQAQVIHSKGVALVYTSELYLPTADDLTAAGAKVTPVTVTAKPTRRGKRPSIGNVPTPQVA